MLKNIEQDVKQFMQDFEEHKSSATISNFNDDLTSQ